MKADTTQNSDGLEEKMEAARKRHEKLFPFRINHHTVILVPKSKRTEEYRQAFIEKVNKEVECRTR
ncbi:hypothetical protein [uncultured Bacteroides sp.]|uniref:hypothetical protein n=1 Tax=uncultured Bacteroides sp. TaxID=162156 RepID=UPI0026160035|nr:hypothetical protein [uncultured Bacteroides sp.]